jgi:hypothetical protein
MLRTSNPKFTRALHYIPWANFLPCWRHTSTVQILLMVSLKIKVSEWMLCEWDLIAVLLVLWLWSWILLRLQQSCPLLPKWYNINNLWFVVWSMVMCSRLASLWHWRVVWKGDFQVLFGKCCKDIMDNCCMVVHPVLVQTFCHPFYQCLKIRVLVGGCMWNLISTWQHNNWYCWWYCEKLMFYCKWRLQDIIQNTW